MRLVHPKRGSKDAPNSNNLKMQTGIHKKNGQSHFKHESSRDHLEDMRREESPEVGVLGEFIQE